MTKTRDLADLGGGFIQTGSGAVQRSVESKLGDVVSVKDFGAVGDGVADDTAAIQAAIAASKQVFFPQGTYLCDGITLTTSGLSGRKLTGASSTTTILKAKASATNFLSITGNYNQHNVFENFAIDMGLMPNTSASRGIYLKQTWGNSFRDVRVIGFGSSARTLYCDVGVYTTVFDNCEFGSVTGTIQLQGISLSDAVTTVTFVGCSFAQCIADQVVSITFLQPIVQGALNKFVLSNTRGFSILSGDIEGTGTYLSLGSNVGHLCSTNNELSGFTGTYSTGSFTDGHLMDLYGSTPFQFKPTAGSTHTGLVTEEITSAGLTRKLVRNTSGSSSTVDVEIKNSAGSSYVGMTGAGAAYLDGRGGGKVTLQNSGVDIVGGDSSNRLIVGTVTATTATAGSNGDVPAQVKGYIRFCNSSGTEVGKIPYYEL